MSKKKTPKKAEPKKTVTDSTKKDVKKKESQIPPFEVHFIDKEELDDENDFRDLLDYEKSLFNAVKEGDVSKFEKALKKFDSDKKKSDDESDSGDETEFNINSTTFVRRWLKDAPEFKFSEAKFTLLMYICYLGNEKLYNLIKDRKDVHFTEENFYPDEEDESHLPDFEDDELEEEGEDDDDDGELDLFALHFFMLGNTKKPNNSMTEHLFKRCKGCFNEGYMSVLYCAAIKGKKGFVQEILKMKGINVNLGINDGEGTTLHSPLHAACVTKKVAIARLILRTKGVNVNEGLEPALCGACESGSKVLVDELLKRKETDINKGKPNTPLYYACKSDSYDIIKLLLGRKNIKVNKGESTPLSMAVSIGKMKVVKHILSIRGIDVNCGKSTPLYEACIAGDIEIVKMLLKIKGIKINKGTTDDGDILTPLYAATMEADDIDIVELLLKRKGIKVNRGDYTALYGACANGNLDIYDLLIAKKGIDPNKGKYSPLKIACENGHVEIVEELLKNKKLDVNKSDEVESSETSLYKACGEGFSDIVEMLLKRPEIKVNKGLEEANGNQKSNLYAAACGGYLDIVKMLLEHKDIDINKGEYTALQGAIENEQDEIVYFFLKNDKINVNKGMITPLRQACLLGRVDYVNALLKRKDIEINILGFDDDGCRVTSLCVCCDVDSNDENIENYVNCAKALLERSEIDVNKGESTPLYCACLAQNIEMVKVLLKNDNIEVNKTVKTENDDDYDKEKTLKWSPLYAAVEGGSTEIVKLLLEREDIEIGSSESPLHCACADGYYEIVELLIKHKGVDVNQLYESDNGWTSSPICAAVMCNELKIVKLLLNERKDCDINLGERTPLCRAAKLGYIDIFTILFDHPMIDINKVEEDDSTEDTFSALYYACLEENEEIALKLLSHPKINVTAGSKSAFHVACESGLMKVVQIMLQKKGIDVNKIIESNNDEYTALYLACVAGDSDVVEELLKVDGIDVNLGTYTPLYAAVTGGYVAIVKMLLEKKEILLNKGTYSPLYGACDHNRLEMVKLLLEQKGIIVDGYVLEAATGKFNIYKELLKFPDIHHADLTLAFQRCCSKNLHEFCILLCLRNIKFSKKKILNRVKNKIETKNIIEEFISNKSKFRHKYSSQPKYDIGIKVREFLKVGLVIGMTEYEHIDELRTAESDASSIIAMLKANKFDRVDQIINDEHCDMLDNFDLFISNVKDLLKKEENMYKTLMIFFFYAGHGVTLLDESLLLPVDFRKKYFAYEFPKLNQKVLSMSRLKTSFSSFGRESVNIIVLDACRSTVDQEMVEKLRNKKEKRMIKEDESMKNIKTRDGITGNVIKQTTRDNYIYCFATDPKAVALDASLDEEKSKNSPFTRALLEHLNRGGNFEDILKKVRNKVLQYTSNNQKPWVNSSLSFPVMWKDDVEAGTKRGKGGGDKKLNEMVKKLNEEKKKMKRGNEMAKLKQKKLEDENRNMKNEIVRLKEKLKKAESVIVEKDKKIKKLSSTSKGTGGKKKVVRKRPGSRK